MADHAYCGATATLVLFPILPQTTTVEGYSATVVMITNHIYRATGRIEGKLAVRYAIPVNGATATTDAVPPILRGLCEDISGFWTMRSYYPKDSVVYTDWLERYQEAFETLDEIRDGDTVITNTAGSVIPELIASSKVNASGHGYTPTFNEDGILDQEQDPDLLRDIATDRAS